MASPCRSRGELLRALARPAVLGSLATLAAGFAPPSLSAYEVDTHMAVSRVALQRPDCVANDYLINQLLLPDGIQTSTPNGTLLARLADGAREEDTKTFSRPRNHFFNPINDSGLNDIFSGAPSLQWAYDHPDNLHDWRGAREAYERFFTAATLAERTTELGNAFFALGHVIHLVQDCAQPQHTRNDAHITYFPGAPYEDYCHTHFATDGAVSGLGTSPIPVFPAGTGPFEGIPASFSSFWDTGQYTGQALFAGFGSTPGLAEYSNAFFITDDTMFGNTRLSMLTRAAGPPLTVRLTEALENNSTQANHRFPSPRFNATNTSSFYPPPTSQVTLQREGEDLAGAVVYATLRVRDLAGNVVHTTPNAFLINADNEIGFDNVVYQSNAQDLLPKAVAYSAGVLNYFFRGKLDIAVRWQEGAQRYQITVTNRTGKPLGAGAWTLYQDDSGQNRAPVSLNHTYPGTLPDGASFTGTFSATSRPGPYTLVFKGTLDDEQNLAVIGKRFEIVRVHITWTPRSDQDLWMWGPNGSVIYWNNLVTANGELDNDNIGGLGPENITLKDLAPGTYQFMVNYYRDWWREKFFDTGTQTCLPYPTPINSPDDLPQFYQCHTPTPITVTVATFHNSSSAVRTVTRTLNEQDYAQNYPLPGTPEGPQGDSWYVTQIVEVDEDRNVTIVGQSPQTAPGKVATPVATSARLPLPRKGDTPSRAVSEVRP